MSNCIHCNRWVDHRYYFGNECIECVYKNTGINGFVSTMTPEIKLQNEKPAWNFPSQLNNDLELQQLREENARLKKIIDKLLDK